jgi:hypothetical protein
MMAIAAGVDSGRLSVLASFLTNGKRAAGKPSG